jgi:hypothetical protein
VALSAMLWTFSVAQAKAQQILNVRVKSGQSTVIGAFWIRGQNYTVHGGTGAFVDHGAVVFRDVSVNRRGNVSSVTQLVYTPNPGFKGVDKVDIPIGPRHLIYNVMVQ